MENSEILVHISAPCGVSDDAHYRAQVEAILGFQSASRQVLTLKPDDTNNDHDYTTSTATSDGLSRPQLPSNNTPLQEPVIPTNDTSDNQAITISNKTIWYEEHELPNYQSHDCSPKDYLDTPVSVIPDSQPGRPSSDTDNLQDVEHQLSIIGAQSFPCSANLTCAKRYQKDSSRLISGRKKMRHSPYTNDEANATQIGDSTVQSTVLSTFVGTTFPVPVEIRPPLPPISKEKFTTHITPTLKMLAARLKSRTYRPLEQIRELDKLERGHWYLRINVVEAGAHDSIIPWQESNGAYIWDMPMFCRFWSFLSEFIKEGRAGWGVWCILEDLLSVQLPHNTQESALREVDTRQLTLKTYAWGEIASHIYLLLFLASERRIRKMGAQWRDSRDDVVIQMP
ncbi:hypothetical protein BDV27DRAFT_133915 [Aspergillus caelatus]|uniref:Uncharacterized protein n=1 Tax=Aspergillus caelatus TaxID=61420 RepID=A0A5N6ZV80_9EURO|nr:uncharacterized protein BDV27DRAFT_133915 [Aspergillus caelatus]KAE8360829.1 hypothetical protein BDV27DRAFT_133915 [Aspergillus caelatus]